MALTLWGLAFACATGPDVAVVDIHTAPAWALAVPAGARVDARADLLRVDAADGSRWFDARWAPADAAPLAVAYDLVAGICETVRWEEPAALSGTLVFGGECSIRGRSHWAVAVLEPHEDRRLALAWLGDEAKVTFEQAWVELLTTTLTLQAGDAPREAPSVPEIRATVRKIAADPKSVGHAQVPGGGTLWRATAEGFPAVWEARRAANMPASF